MVRERWLVDGFELTDGWLRDVELRDGLYNTAAPSSQAQETYVVGRHGYLDSLRRTHDGGSFVVQAWFVDTSWIAVERAWELLLRAAGQQHRLAHWERQLADGTWRECFGRIGNVVEPKALGNQGIRCSLEVHVPAAFWQDETATQDSTVAGAALPQVLPLASKAAATAPMTDLVYTITGPVTDPTVQVTSDPVIADSFTVQAAVPGGASVTLDSGSWEVTAVGMAAPTLDKVIWTGNRLLEVPPAPPGQTPTVELTGTGGAGGTRLLVAGRGKYQAA